MKRTMTVAVVAALMASLLTVVGVNPSGAAGERVGFVAVSASPPGVDRAVRDRLVGAGYDVTFINDNSVTHDLAETFDVIYVSSTVSPGAVNTKLNRINTPIVVAEPNLFNKLGMVTGASSQRGEVSGQTTLTIADDTHPIAAGFSGDIVAADPKTPFTFGIPNENATVIAHSVADPTKAMLFEYELASEMPGGTAPHRRIGVFPSYGAPNRLTEDGWSLILAAVERAADTSGLPNLPPTVEAGPDITVEVGEVVAMAGTVADDGRPAGTLDVSWTGPSAAFFADDESPTTASSFSAEGVYTLTLTADDGESTASDDVVVTVVPASALPTALFVAATAVPPWVDRPGATRLEELGFDVVLIADENVDVASTAGVDLIVISASINPSLLPAEFADLPIPILVWEAQSYDELGMTGGGSNKGVAATKAVKIDTEAEGHPLAAGLTGRVLPVNTNGLSWGKPSDEAIVVAAVANSSNKKAVFAYEKGAQMADRPAPERRVGLYLGPRGPQKATADGMLLFDAAIEWLTANPLRPTDGLVAMYNFDEGTGTTVTDRAPTAAPVDLEIADGGAVTWLADGGLSVDSATVIASNGAATGINDAIAASGETTIEAWIDPADLNQNGPARILAISESLISHNLLIGQGEFAGGSDLIETRFRTDWTSSQGQPGMRSGAGTLVDGLSHVVLTRAIDRTQRLFIDGVLQSERVVGGATGAWDSTMPLVLANELNGGRDWQGEFHLVSIYNRALRPVEVCDLTATGPVSHFAGTNMAPRACVLPVGEAEVGTSVSFDASGSTDLDGDIASVLWDFGGGSTSTDAVTSTTFAAAGDTTVTLTLTDDLGATTTVTIPVTVVDPPTPPGPWSFDDTLGYRAGGGFFTAADHDAAEALIGNPINYTVQFLDRGSAVEMTSSSFGLFEAGTAELPRYADDLDLSLTVPLAFGNNRPINEAGLAAIRAELQATADGDNDARYVQVAEQLVAAGFEDAILRLGHEFNGNWAPYSAFENEDVFIAAWQRVHDVFMASSQEFRFDWNIMRINFDRAFRAWPGDEYVDIVSIDVYWQITPGDPNWRLNKWNTQYLDRLQRTYDWAVEHGAQFAIPEWAVEDGDTPEFINAMANFMKNLPQAGPGSLAYHAYFDSLTGERLADFPLSEAAYIAQFGPTP